MSQFRSPPSITFFEEPHSTLEYDVLRVQFQTTSAPFFRKYKNLSLFHKSLSNGWNQVNKQTNRSWWNSNVDVGLYKHNVSSEVLILEYFIRFQTTDVDKLWNQLRYRIPSVYHFSMTQRLPNVTIDELRLTWDNRPVYKSFGKIETLQNNVKG